MSEKFVTFVRQRDALAAVVSLANEEEIGLSCALVPRRIEEVRESVCASAPVLARAWRTLAWSRLEEAGDIAAAVIVLLETVPIEDRGAPRLPTGSSRLRRADLRGPLATQGAWLAVREALRSRRRRAFRMLCEAGYEERRLTPLTSARDPYVAYHHGAPAEAGLSVLPRPFRTSMLPLLRGRDWADVMRSLRLFRELALEHDPDLLALVVRLLAVSPGHGPAWCAAAGTQLPEQRRVFLRVLLQLGAAAVDPSRVDSAALGSLAGVDAARYHDRLTYLLRSVRAGYPSEYAVEGFRIADEFAPDYDFAPWRPRGDAASPAPSVPAGLDSVLRPVLARIGPVMMAEEYGSSFALFLWSRCVHDRTFVKLLERPAVRNWPDRTLFRVLRQLIHERDVPCDEQLRAIEPLLAALPETHHGKALEALGELLSRWRRADERAQRLPVACALLARLARPPFQTDVECGPVVGLLVDGAWPRRVARLLSAPDECLARLEAALHRDNQAGLVVQGLEAMARRTGGLLVEALIRNPESLFATARLLGCLREPRRLAQLNRYRANPIAHRRFLARPLEQISRMVEPLVRDGLSNPIPRRLRDHLSGRIALTPGSVERHRQAVERGLFPLKLGLLRRMALADLGRGLPVVDPGRADERHALQMAGTTYTNRRMLRRVLGVAPAARRDFLLAHPSNQAWLRRHPRVDAALWTRGIEQVASDGRAPLRLALETEPLAVLKLGTEVGSCLSVGGCWSDSAVAVMVDVNKQVIFARRPDGTFVARQVAAVSEDEQLVFFSVYPISASAEVKEAFHRYDLAFAAALGLRAYEQREEDTFPTYQIAPLLARSFHDDGPWDRLVVTAAGAP